MPAPVSPSHPHAASLPLPPTNPSAARLKQRSPRLRISNGEAVHHSPPLSLFSHIPLPSSSTPNSPTSGGIAFAGGPVSALAWHPCTPGICIAAAHSIDHPTHHLLQCYEGLAYIQLWRLLPSSHASACIALIPHHAHCVWDLKWRPLQPPANPSTADAWSGQFAAALGDGTVIVYRIEHFVAPPAPSTPPSCSDIHPKPTANPDPPFLQPKTIVLRIDKNRHHHSASSSPVPVRVVEWSPDGTRLIVGAANGNIHVYDVDTHHQLLPACVVPAQESVVCDVRWLSPTLYCTLGMSCVLRLCDVRDPLATLEQNAEGLQGSLSMAVLEPHVAVVGADAGFLRVTRLTAIDGIPAQSPVRRVCLQTSPFRDMRTLHFRNITALYTGGAEGILHEVVFPRPLWPAINVCNIDKTVFAYKLRWAIDDLHDDHSHRSQTKQEEALHEINPRNGRKSHDRDQGNFKPKLDSCEEEPLHLQLGSAVPELPQTMRKDPVDPVVIAKRKKSASRKRGLLGRPSDGTEGAFFGDRYKQPVVITRIAVNPHDDLIAVGIDGGFITWLPVNSEKLVEDHGQEDFSASAKRKGRRRTACKVAVGEDDITETVPSSSGAHSTIPVPPSETDVPFKMKVKREPKLPVYGPKRKRGRPRKHPAIDVPVKKGKRGRPRKVITDGSPPPKRKRGRPRKIAAPETDDAERATLTAANEEDSLHDGGVKQNEGAALIVPKSQKGERVQEISITEKTDLQGRDPDLSRGTSTVDRTTTTLWGTLSPNDAKVSTAGVHEKASTAKDVADSASEIQPSLELVEESSTRLGQSSSGLAEREVVRARKKSSRVAALNSSRLSGHRHAEKYQAGKDGRKKVSLRLRVRPPLSP